MTFDLCIHITVDVLALVLGLFYVTEILFLTDVLCDVYVTLCAQFGPY